MSQEIPLFMKISRVHKHSNDVFVRLQVYKQTYSTVCVVISTDTEFMLPYNDEADSMN